MGGGGLSKVPAHTLGAEVIKALLAGTQGKIKPEDVGEVIIGQVLTAGCGQNPARQAAIHAGIPQECPSMTINKVCGSGLKALHLAAQSIACGDASIVIAGGQENMSLTPHVLPKSRDGQRMGDWKLSDSMVADGLWCAFNNYHMGVTAENIAEQYGIGREAQDAFAVASQEKASAAKAAGKFAEQIVPIAPGPKDKTGGLDHDEYIKEGVSLEKFAKMRPAFSKTGTVTAASASGINDGAALCLLMTEEKAKELGLPFFARIRSFAAVGVDPKIMGTGPITASKKALEKAGWTTDDLDLIEANEAFAVQALSVNQGVGWDAAKVNVNGGAIAIGHPIGASGCRIAVDLLHEMKRSGKNKGLATLCIGGGQGVAMCFERV